LIAETFMVWSHHYTCRKCSCV